MEASPNLRQQWTDLWQHRELLYFLAWRDIAVRYKQTVIGIAWTVLRPLLAMLVFTVVFNRLAHLHATAGVPYAVLVFAGLLPWMFFSTAVVESASSLVDNANMVSKVYFPRLILPVSAVVVAVTDFAIALGLLAILLLALRFVPSVQLIAVPVFLVLGACAALGFGLWLAALNVRYRDFRYVIPFVMQIGIYISPVGFSSALVPDRWRALYALNPMVGVIDGFRWAIIGRATPLPLQDLAESLLVTALLLGSGLWYFYRSERTFADVI